MRVFARSGEITAKRILDSFAQWDSSTLNYYSKHIRDYGGFDSVQFKANGRAELFESNGWNEYDYTQQGNSLVLTRSVSSKICCTFGEEFTNTVSYHMMAVKPEIEFEYVVSSTSGNYIFGYFGRPTKVLKREGGQWQAPLSIYLLHKSNFGLQPGPIINSDLPSDFYKHILEGDTIALRELTLTFQ